MRDGHDIKNVTIWLKELEDADADKLVAFLKEQGMEREVRGVRERLRFATDRDPSKGSPFSAPLR